MDNFSAVNRKENNITDLSYSTYYAHFNEQKWLRDEVEYWRKINRSIPHYSYATKTDMVNTNLSKRLEYFKFKDRRMGIDERRMFSREVVYLARICKVFETVFHHTSICFDIAKHGRDIVFDDSTSLERLIGRFDVRFPMYIDFKSFNGNFDRHDLLDQLLKEVPVNGLNYQKIKSELKDEFNAYLSPQILFNFLGTINKPVTKYTNISLVKTGTSSILKFNRNYEFEFHIWVDNNEVFLRFEYSKSRVDNLIIKNISDGLNLEFAKNPS
jgi:hypothetical protein